ncbi:MULTISPECIES: 2'-5' RNA ligase family protein [Kocuria]|uniref:2'-5' RNA ligase family protein n=1 Tax=Kocuria TaxID=57493 RepID=UPI000EF1DA3E|nr:2'-5' RNA ligase family protein [Kocuria rhizophila]WIW69229.1 2'-5' RNA ligase family protein [Kocuria sp. ChxB]MCT1545048.1 2'-5' RNA ligase family protein [Kocuria rhizophila]MCT2170705.1 2'-5' RNA ligase family protein [Kocuria rhizophila]RLP60175.1 2'-5' RNA ligase family protein [Kocuria rhizophila]WSY87501.1 2'-5' RNA ligase family protein [Kocuria rhizophila]
MPLYSLDLVLAPGDDALVRARWDALDRAGLPSQARHRSSSNAPHLTVVSAPGFSEAVLQRARELFGPLLPFVVPVTGLTVLGRGPYVLAESLAVPPAVLGAVAELRALLPEQRTPAGPWVPHVTLGTRLDAPAVGRALEVLSDVAPPRSLDVTALRRWDPDAREVTVEVP